MHFVSCFDVRSFLFSESNNECKFWIAYLVTHFGFAFKCVTNQSLYNHEKSIQLFFCFPSFFYLLFWFWVLIILEVINLSNLLRKACKMAFFGNKSRILNVMQQQSVVSARTRLVYWAHANLTQPNVHIAKSISLYGRWPNLT